MKKLFILVFTVICSLSLVFLGGCKKDDGKTHVTFYHTMGANLQTVLNKYIGKFNEVYPDIVIDHEAIGSYDDVRDQVITQLQAGTQPTLAYCYPDHVAAYLRSKKVVDLNTYINDPEVGLTTAQIDDFIEGYYAEGHQFGDDTKMYSLPFSKSTEVMYYNKTFFEEHEIAIPTHWFATGETDTTSMEYVIEQIKTIDPNCVPLGYDSEANWFITMTEQLNTPYTAAVTDVSGRFLFNDTRNIAFLKAFKTWHEEGWLTTQAVYGGYTSGLFTNLKEVDGKVLRSYISIGSSAGATYQCPAKLTSGEYPFEVGIAPIPQADTNNQKVISQGPSITMLKQRDEAVNDAAWLFVKFLLTNVNFQAEFSMASGYVPVLKSTFEVDAYESFLAEAGYTKETIAALSAKVCMEQENNYFTSPAFVGSTDARDQVGQLVISVITAGKTATDADILDLFQDAVDKCVTLNQ
ncbi:MAG: extracellular solute-binding protein [Bacilli bacterium]|nr:extracellular solute-binding protein [Bacilli bacterium]